MLPVILAVNPAFRHTPFLNRPYSTKTYDNPDSSARRLLKYWDRGGIRRGGRRCSLSWWLIVASTEVCNEFPLCKANTVVLPSLFCWLRSRCGQVD